MFSRDVYHYRQTPRTLQTSKFGAYSQLSVDRRKKIAERALDWACAIAFVIGVGAATYLVVSFHAGMTL